MVYCARMEIPHHLLNLPEVGLRLKGLRETSGLTLDEIAERCGLRTSNTLYGYFSGDREMGAVTLALFAHYCGTTPNGVLLRQAPDTLEAHEFPRVPAAKRANLIRMINNLVYLDGISPAGLDQFKLAADTVENLAKELRRVYGEPSEHLSLASEEPAAYGETEAGESLETRASEAIALALEEMSDVTSPAALRLMEIQRDLIEKAGAPGNAGGLGRRGVGGESADVAEAAGVSAGASSLAAGPKHRQKRKPNK